MDAHDGVLILAGPTASGKTGLAVDLARRFGAEIVGADSRQIYRGMPVGTAAPSARQLAAVPHHLVGFLDPHERYSAARYAEDAMAAVEEIRSRGKRVIIAGGTGFYIRALIGSVELAPELDETVRNRLAREAQLHDAAFLHEWLRYRDRRRAAALHASDRYRVLRALEIALAPARRRSAPLRTLAGRQIPFLLVFLAIERGELDRRIAARTERMLHHGLLEEAERVGAGAVASTAVGYPQALAFLHGWSTFEELERILERATRRYARRQETWFRGEPDALWLQPEAVERAAREKLGWV